MVASNLLAYFDRETYRGCSKRSVHLDRDEARDIVGASAPANRYTGCFAAGEVGNRSGAWFSQSAGG